MSCSSSNYDSEENFYTYGKHLNDEIERCKDIITSGNIYGAIETLEETVQLCIDHDKYIEGLEFADALLEHFPYNSEYWMKSGVFLNGLFRFDEALSCFDKSLSLNPGDTETLIDKATAEENLGLYEAAGETLRKALNNEPNNEDALFNLALLCQRKNRTSEAITYLKPGHRDRPSV